MKGITTLEHYTFLHNFFPSELEQSTVTNVANPFVDSDTFLMISEISVGILDE